MVGQDAQLILASRSPRRAALLRQLGLEFRVFPSEVKEKLSKEEPGEAVKLLALQKARDVARRVNEGLVIGADTVVVLGTEILSKPSCPDAARQMLRKLSGRQHQVLTGVALVDASGKRPEVSKFESTRVFFRVLKAREISAYIATGEPLDKAGSYGIQGRGAIFVEKIEGCYFNVVGLPLALLGKMLSTFGINILPVPQKSSSDEGDRIVTKT